MGILPLPELSLTLASDERDERFYFLCFIQHTYIRIYVNSECIMHVRQYM